MISAGQEIFDPIRQGIANLRQGVLQGQTLREHKEDREAARAELQAQQAGLKTAVKKWRESGSLMGVDEGTWGGLMDAVESGNLKMSDIPSFLPKENDPLKNIQAKLLQQQASETEAMFNASGPEREEHAAKLGVYQSIYHVGSSVDAASKGLGWYDVLNSTGASVLRDTVARTDKVTGAWTKDLDNFPAVEEGVAGYKKKAYALAAQDMELMKGDPDRRRIYQRVAARLPVLTPEQRLEAEMTGKVHIQEWMEASGQNEPGLADIPIDITSFPSLKMQNRMYALGEATVSEFIKKERFTKDEMDLLKLSQAAQAEKLQKIADEEGQQQGLKIGGSEGVELPGKTSEISEGATSAMGVLRKQAGEMKTIGDFLSPIKQAERGVELQRGISKEFITNAVSNIREAIGSAKTAKLAIGKFLDTPIDEMPGKVEEYASDIIKEFSERVGGGGPMMEKIKQNYSEHIQGASEQYGVRPELIAAVIAAESGGRPEAKSPKGAGGLMQIMPDTAKGLSHDVSTEEGNIYAGTEYLGKMLKRFNGDERLALAAYNAGPGNVENDKWKSFKETTDYVEKVQKYAGSKLGSSKEELAEFSTKMLGVVTGITVSGAGSKFIQGMFPPGSASGVVKSGVGKTGTSKLVKAITSSKSSNKIIDKMVDHYGDEVSKDFANKILSKFGVTLKQYKKAGGEIVGNNSIQLRKMLEWLKSSMA